MLQKTLQILKFDKCCFRATDKSLLYRDELGIGTKQDCRFDHKQHCTPFTSESFLLLFVTGGRICSRFQKLIIKGL